MYLYITINEDERGLLIRNGRFEKLLKPGRHRLFDFGFSQQRVEKFPVRNSELTSDWARIIEKNYPRLATQLFETVRTKENQLALVSFDDQPVHLVGPWQTRYFWKVLTDVNVEMINCTDDGVLHEKYHDAINQTNAIRDSLVSKVVIEENQRGFATRNGKFEALLEPGLFFIFSGKKEKTDVLKFDVKESEFMSGYWPQVIEQSHPELAARLFETVSPGEGEVAMVFFDGRPVKLVGPWDKCVFWKVMTEVTTEFINTKTDIRVSEKHRNAIHPSAYDFMSEHIIEENQAGLLYIDGEFTERLEPGRHTFWKVNREVSIYVYDLRPEPIEITAQEILTRDRISLRVTLTAFSKVLDPEKVKNSSSDHITYIYRLVQFAVREAIANRTLDELLNAREKVDNQVRAYVKEHMDDIGVEITELGIKDIILPGEMRELINKVVAAEKTAQANLIRRREETAATRSLLNTAKLMENNPLLLRLKELESLEKLTEKVGRIDLHTGETGGFDALMSKLLTLDPDK